MGTADFVILLIGLLLLFLISLWREKKGEQKILSTEGMRTMACFAILLVILVFGCYGKGYDISSFIYSQF